MYLKILAWSLLIIHFGIFMLWIADSEYLFSLFGVAIWFTAIVSAFLVQKQINKQLTIRRLLIVSNFFMVFLSVVTVGVFYITNSMH